MLCRGEPVFRPSSTCGFWGFDDAPIWRLRRIFFLANFYGHVCCNNFLFNGNASIREINRSLSIELPDQFVTLSGLIHDIAKEIPKVGKIVTYKEFKLQIISRSINKINKVKLIL